jgi:hypothetical protein
MKETFWSKLRELWAIRQRCQQIKLQQRQNRLPRSMEFYGGTQRLTKIVLPKTRRFRLAQAGSLSEAARLNIATAAWRVRSRVRKSLLDLYAGREIGNQLRFQQGTQQ